MNEESENLYDILKSPTTATLEELKRNYQTLAKQHHPDKNSNSSNELFTNIDKAWKILRDEDARKQYDAKLLNQSHNLIIYDTITRSQLVFKDSIGKYLCKCGSEYTIYEHPESDSEEYIECDECSLTLCVK